MNLASQQVEPVITDEMIPSGFRFASDTIGIKASGKPDLTLIVADERCSAAGVYTTNLIHAASIDWNRSLPLERGMRGLVINSGNANACTGERGEKDNARMAALAASATGDVDDAFFVMSTGVIGHFLPMEKLEKGIPSVATKLAAGADPFHRAARGIMTTDQFMKVAFRTIELKSGKVRIAAMAKGAGMIGPRMATMLAVILTDAKVSSSDLKQSLAIAADASFNCISVEGHMSTNDSMVVMASGKVDVQANELKQFQHALTEACIELAKLIPTDGEGAKHLIAIDVQGAQSNDDARKIADCIANSPLVKTAITGNDPNWGRIVSAAGYAGVSFDPKQVDLELCGFKIFEAGQPTKYVAADVSREMGRSAEVKVLLTVGSGPGRAHHWTSDLTCEYVTFNSDYTT